VTLFLENIDGNTTTTFTKEQKTRLQKY